MKIRKRINSIYSSSSDDEVPLKLLRPSLKNGSHGESSQHSMLFEHREEPCEFCEQTFYNRYDMLIHNAKHIIIPLLKQILHQCSECHCYFTSLEEHRFHAATKHNITSVPNILEDFFSKEPRVKCDNSVNELIREKLVNDSLKDMIKKEPRIHIDDSINELIKENNAKKNSLIQKGLRIPSDDNNVLIKENDAMRNSLIQMKSRIPCDDNKEVIKENDAEKNNLIQFEDSDDEEINEYGSNIIKKEPTIRWNDNTSELIKENNVITNNLFQNKPRIQSSESNNEKDRSSTSTLHSIKKGNSSIRSRLVFEDELDENDYSLASMNFKFDLMPESCGQGKRDTRKLEAENRGVEVYTGKIVLGNKVENCKEITPRCVSYEDLKKPGLFRCKRCRRNFPDKFELIIHETTHLKIKNRRPHFCKICDRYIAGNHYTLNKHIKSKHPNTPRRNYTLTNCRKCGLKYNNFYRHINNYHNIYICSLCGKGFETDSERLKHKDEHISDINYNIGTYDVTKYVKVCDICSLFFKNTQKHTYKYVKDLSKLGERQTCERCGKEFFELKLIKFVHRRRLEKIDDNKKKVSSNESRLKNIQQRLKNYNKMSHY